MNLRYFWHDLALVRSSRNQGVVGPSSDAPHTLAVSENHAQTFALRRIRPAKISVRPNTVGRISIAVRVGWVCDSAGRCHTSTRQEMETALGAPTTTTGPMTKNPTDAVGPAGRKSPLALSPYNVARCTKKRAEARSAEWTRPIRCYRAIPPMPQPGRHATAQSLGDSADMTSVVEQQTANRGGVLQRQTVTWSDRGCPFRPYRRVLTGSSVVARRCPCPHGLGSAQRGVFTGVTHDLKPAAVDRGGPDLLPVV